MDRKKLLLVLLLIICLGPFSFSQTPSNVFKNITIDDGLSQNSVVSITQDNLGFMWFATQDGLNRFDGKNFRIYPVSFDDITNPENSRLGKLHIQGNDLWMITRGGKLEVLDLVTEEFKHVEKFLGANELLPPIRSILVEEDGKIWLGTESQGVFLVNRNFRIQKHFHTEGPSGYRISSNRINQIYRDLRDRLWILTDSGINEIGKGKPRTYMEGIMVNTICDEPSGTILVGTQGKGIYYKSHAGQDFFQFNRVGREAVPTDLTVKTMIMDEQLRLWVGTYGNGLYVVDRRYSTLEHYLPHRSNPHSIGFQDILSIFRDEKKGIWLGTDGGGISFYDKSFGNFQLLLEQHVPEDIAIEQIRAITTDREGKIWFGTSGNGFTRYDPATYQFDPFHLEPFKPGIKNYNRVVAMYSDDSGDLWLGTHGNGTMVFCRKSGKVKKWFTTEAENPEQKVPDNTIWTFLAEGPDRVWAGSRYSGLLLLDKQKGMIKRFYETGSPQDNIRAIIRINDSILALGYERKGVKLLNTYDGSYKVWLPEIFRDELDRVEIKCLYYLNGWLWAGTGGKGIVASNLETGAVKRFTETEGLPNNMIYGILEEDSRTLWGSTNRGLFRLTYEKVGGDLDIDKISSYDSSNGLQSNEFNTGAFHRSASGDLYFGGIKGLNYFDPSLIPERREKINIIISEARVDNVPFKGNRSITYEDRLDLLYRENSIAVNYTAINFVSPEKLNYTYMLEGYDDDWIQAGTRNYTAYTNLPPGDYIFKVKLADNMLDEAPVTTLGISVATPYWQEWWFLSLMALGVLLLLFTIYRVRIHQFLELQRVKDSISADLHDDLGSRLTTIHLLSAISRNKFTKDPELSRMLNNIDREIYASSEALDEIVWNIKMTNESLPDTIAKIRRYISEVLENAGITYSIDTSEDLSPYHLSMQKRRELFLICKELVNNIRKHSHASEVAVKLGTQKNMLYLSVSDNGKGFDPLMKTHRNGISNLRQRVQKWSGELKIQSGPEQGCLIEIGIPFDRAGILNRFMRRE